MEPTKREFTFYTKEAIRGHRLRRYVVKGFTRDGAKDTLGRMLANSDPTLIAAIIQGGNVKMVREELQTESFGERVVPENEQRAIEDAMGEARVTRNRAAR